MTEAQQIGRYQLLHLLGKGGAGEVWEALLQGPAGFRKTVALKLVHKGLDEEEDEALLREARLGALLRHPYLVDVYEVGQAEDGRWFLAMELVAGPSLQQVLQKMGGLPGRALKEVGEQVCAAVAHAHDLKVQGRPTGLVHRDLKPGNILIDPAGIAKVADFGIARLTGDAVTMIEGTPGYVAPEQLEDEAPDPRSDQFAIGMLLWAMARGRAPLRPKGIDEVVAAARTAEDTVQRPAVRELLDDTLPGLADLVLRCLRREPKARYPHVHALLRALRRLPAPDGHGLVGVLDTMQESTEEARRPRPEPVAPLEPEPGALIGRLASRRVLEDLLCATEHPVVTLRGIGGVGKTRLALHIAHRWQRAGRPVAWCDLTSLPPGRAIRGPVAKALGVALSGSRRGRSDQLDHALSARGALLLVLDNAEHVVEGVRAALARWSKAAPHLAVLCTSRHTLGVPGEVVHELHRLDPAEGVDLFRALARRLDPREDHLIEELVRRLDALPLAIELAAARTELLGVREQLDRIRQEGSGRQGSLEGALRWSWEQLPAHGQAALAQLTAFRGGFSLDDAEAVIDLSPWPRSPWTLDVVDDLRHRSLLHLRQTPQGPRLSLYETVRDFAARMMPDQARRAGPRHGAWYARLGQRQALEALRRKGSVARVRTLELAFEELVHATRAALTRRDAKVAVPTCLATTAVLLHRGDASLGRELIQEVLKLPGGVGHAHLLLALGGLLHNEGLTDRAHSAIERSAQLCEHNPALLAKVHMTQSQWFTQSGQPTQARRLAALALKIAQGTGDAWLISEGRWCLGSALHKSGHSKSSTKHLRAALRGFAQVGDRLGQGRALSDLAYLRAGSATPGAALKPFRKALEHFEALDHRPSIASVHLGISSVLMNIGRLKEAERSILTAIECYRDSGQAHLEATAHSEHARLLHHRGDFEASEARYIDALLLIRHSGMRGNIAITLNNLADLRRLMGRYEEAERDLKEAIQLCHDTGYKRLGVVALATLGAVRRAQGRAKEACELLRKAIRIARAIPLPWAVGAFSAELGAAYLDLNELPRARGALEEALPILADSEDGLELGKLHCHRSRLALLQGDRLGASEALAAAFEQRASTSDPELDRQIRQAAAALRG